MGRLLTRADAARLAIAGAAATGCVAAWLALGSGGHDVAHPHGSASPYLPTVAIWTAMVVAMMTPTALPWVLAFHRLLEHAEAVRRSPGAGTAAFAAGYLVVWLAFSAAAAAVQSGLAMRGALAGGQLASMAGGAVLIAAGVFQFSSWKQACLSHCRNPISYFLTRWRNGPTNGFRMGVAHGGYCLGCCWLTMATGFAMGVMNVAWMAALTAVIAAEQVAPARLRVDRAAGAGFVAWGLWLIAR